MNDKIKKKKIRFLHAYKHALLMDFIGCFAVYSPVSDAHLANIDMPRSQELLDSGPYGPMTRHEP